MALLTAITRWSSAVVFFFDTNNHKLAGTGGQYLAMAVVSLGVEGPGIPVFSHREDGVARGIVMEVGHQRRWSIRDGPGCCCADGCREDSDCDLLRVLRCARVVGQRHVKARMRIGIEELSMAAFGGQIAVALFALGVAVGHSNSETMACSACFVVGLVWLIVMGRRHGRRDFRRT